MKEVIASYTPEDLAREGLEERPAVWEDGIRAPTAAGHFEWWYFDAHFDDGSTAVIVFYTKAILNRQADLSPGVSVTITRPDGEKLVRFLDAPPAAFSASKERCDVCIGPHRVNGNLQQYELSVRAGDLAADLKMQAAVPAWRPGAGKNYYDPGREKYFGWLAAVPFGSIRGTLVYDGQAHAVSGTFYHDHNWGNVGLEQVMSHWYWGRAQCGDYTLIFVEMHAVRRYGGQKMPVFLLARGDQVLLEDGRPLVLHASDYRQHPGGRSYPHSVDFTWSGAQGTVQLKLRHFQEIEATSLLGALPRWKQGLARLAGANPYYFRFNTELQLDISLESIQAKETGKALLEIMLLR